MLWIILDENNILRDLASKKGNLSVGHSYAGAKELLIDLPHGIKVGDEFNPKTGAVIPHHENYIKPSAKEKHERIIAKKMRTIAIERCKTDGDLPPDYDDLSMGR